MSGTLAMRNGNTRPQSGPGEQMVPSFWNSSCFCFSLPPLIPQQPPILCSPLPVPFPTVCKLHNPNPEEYLAFYLPYISFSSFSVFLHPPEKTFLEESVKIN